MGGFILVQGKAQLSHVLEDAASLKQSSIASIVPHSLHMHNLSILADSKKAICMGRDTE